MKTNLVNSFYTRTTNVYRTNGMSFNVNENPELNVRLLNTIFAKENTIDFGSANFFKYTKSTGESQAIFSKPDGGLCRPISEDIERNGYDRETERYIHFWNNLGSGNAFLLPPGNHHLPSLGYSDDEIRSYLEKAGISKGIFSVKTGSVESEFFYSGSEQYPIYKKKDYDLRYHTMTSADFAFDKSVFRCLEPGTEITIAGNKYTLKSDFTLDIPYGTDIFDIQIPKHTHTSKVDTGFDSKG